MLVVHPFVWWLQAEGPQRMLCPASVSGGGAKNATLGESATRLEVGFPMPRFD